MIIKKNGNLCTDKVYKLTVMPVSAGYYDAGETDNKDRWDTSGEGTFESKRKAFREEAEREAREIKEAAYKAGTGSGYRDGYAKGYNEARGSFERELDTIGKIKKGLEEYREEILKMSEKEIVRLSIAIAGKIVRQTIMENSSIVIDSVKVALKSVPHLDKLIIHMNPEDYEYMNSKGEEIKEIMNRYKEIRLVDDKRIEKGGCVIETEMGNIDTQVSSQLKKVSGEILGESGENRDK